MVWFRIPVIEQQRLEHRPNRSIGPMLTEDVSRVDTAGDEVEGNHARSDGLADTVERQDLVTLVQFSFDACGTRDNGVIVAEHVALFPDWHTEVT